MPERSPVSIHFREYGQGRSLIFLHGGWGYQIYPFDAQIDSLADEYRIIIPDRTGYGRSEHLELLPVDFHQRAAVETIHLLDALEIERPIIWGHSDGAVIAAMMGLRWPEKLGAVILEAFHFYRFKPGSREFFETMAVNPLDLGERVCATLERDHGPGYWQSLIVSNGRAWLGLADQSTDSKHDLYDGKLSELRISTLFIHGSRDPRTEPGEIQAVRRELPGARFAIIEGGGHSPHSSNSTAHECTRVALEFMKSIELKSPP
jgi:pimeloyl-ACP methyl ester carboxylesterase